MPALAGVRRCDDPRRHHPDAAAGARARPRRLSPTRCSQRFRNPAIVHRLDQIAQDGSQKLPYRLGDTLLANRAAGRMPRACRRGARLLGGVPDAARARQASRSSIPPADRLAARHRDGTPADVVDATDRCRTGLPELRDDAAARSAIADAAERISRGDWSGLNL